MSSTKKIILNVAATYARSILSFVFGLFTVRWILEALGHSDYGLYGLVGGIMTFLSMLNATQSASVARFYAYAIGKKSVTIEESCNKELNRLFNAALAMHMALMAIIVIIGYPIGIYAINHWLDVPANRIEAALFVLKCSFVSLVATAIVAPYTAMFVGYQLIRQLVLFSFVQVFGIVAVAYLLLRIDGDRLKWYAAMMLFLTIVVCLLHFIFATLRFRECRIRFRFMVDTTRICEILRFSTLKLMGDIAWCCLNAGNSFVTNLNFGTLGNAANGVATQLSTQAASLGVTLNNAFAPAITMEEGAGRRNEVIKMALQSCKFGSLLWMLVAVPLFVEVDNWLVIWLKNPPLGASILCRCFLVSVTITFLTKGLQLAIQAHGKIGRWQLFDSLSYIAGVPIAILLALMGYGLCSIGLANIAAMCLVAIFRLIFSRKLLGVSIRQWLKRVVAPLLLLGLGTYMIALSCAGVIGNGVSAIIVVTGLSTCSILVLGWLIAFTKEEKIYLKGVIRSRIDKWKR